MKWEDNGIILSFKQFSEGQYIVHILTEHNGRHKGMIRKSSKELAKVQLGNIVFVRWNARLSDHMGTFMIEVNDIPYARIMHDHQKLLALSWGCHLLDMALPERHPYALLYETFLAFLSKLHANALWQKDLVQLEYLCLQELGFGFDWESCALCGCFENLKYISPKTGRASCDLCGAPYKQKLLLLPEILRDEAAPMTGRNLEAAFHVTGHFLQRILPDVTKNTTSQYLIRQQLIPFSEMFR